MMELHKMKAIINVLVHKDKRLIMKAREKYEKRFDIDSIRKNSIFDEFDEYLYSERNNSEFSRRSTSF